MRKAEVTSDPEVIQWAPNKKPSSRARITTLWRPQAGWLFRSTPNPEPEKPTTHPCSWLSRSSMPHLGTPATETQTCSSTDAALWSGFHKSHYSEPYVTLLYSWHRLGPSGSAEWTACLHNLKGYCETRQSTTTKINEGNTVTGSRFSQLHYCLTKKTC